MAKAINWSAQFRDEILSEGEQKTHAAVRVGRLYYDGGYWMPGEEVDIRCNHLRMRRAIIEGELLYTPIGALPDEVFAQLKSAISDPEALINYLSETYHLPVDEATEVTVVRYRNLPVNPDAIEQEPDESGRHL